MNLVNMVEVKACGCDHDAKPSLAVPSVKPVLHPEIAAPTGSRRRRLWNLPHQCHCPVVGVCLPLDTLRRLVNKTVDGLATADDYLVHVCAVSECAHRNQLSEHLHDELERLYLREVKAYRLAKTTQAVADLWATDVRQGDVSGAFWAALTHPRCDDLLQEALCRDMHMLQHQAGATVRRDLARINALVDENAMLTRELGKVQERSTRLLSERHIEIERLNAQIVQLRADNLTKGSRLAFLSEDLLAVKASIPGFETTARLQKKIDQMAARQSERDDHNAALVQQLAAATRALDALRGDPMAAVKPDALRNQAAGLSPVTVYLQQKTVLCVGGRSGNIANYRDLVEKVGGRFSHHDGGLEDSQSLLDASLVAADLVICQTGCISHNAYWKVKDFCKRTGKRCVFLENPSASSLARGLEQISDPSGKDIHV